MLNHKLSTKVAFFCLGFIFGMLFIVYSDLLVINFSHKQKDYGFMRIQSPEDEVDNGRYEEIIRDCHLSQDHRPLWYIKMEGPKGEKKLTNERYWEAMEIISQADRLEQDKERDRLRQELNTLIWEPLKSLNREQHVDDIEPEKKSRTVFRSEAYSEPKPIESVND